MASHPHPPVFYLFNIHTDISDLQPHTIVLPSLLHERKEKASFWLFDFPKSVEEEF